MTLNMSNKDLITRRREMVSSLRLRGLSLREIAIALASQSPPMVNPKTLNPFDVATIKADIDALKKEWRANASADIAEHHARQLAELELVKRTAWANKDPELALKALGLEVKLTGTLRQPDGVNINISLTLVQETVLALEAAGLSPVETFEQLIRQAGEKVASDNGG